MDVELALDMVSVHDFQLVGHDHITGRIERDGILDGDGSLAKPARALSVSSSAFDLSYGTQMRLDLFCSSETWR
jgi:hypothetical protein